MEGLSSNSCSSSSSSLSAVRPKSPPGALDLFGKRRQLVKVQILEREIGLLQEELKSVEDLQPASRCCKELNDFVAAKPDPLVSINKEIRESHLCWKKLCLPWICCFSGCQPHLKMPKFCACCPLCDTHLNICSCSEKKACQHCCKSTGLSCPRFGCCCCFSSSLCECAKVNLCCSCSNTCCKSCCL